MEDGFKKNILKNEIGWITTFVKIFSGKGNLRYNRKLSCEWEKNRSISKAFKKQIKEKKTMVVGLRKRGRGRNLNK